ncbi:MAG TPA: damage-inducible protein DinB, partial [Roseovarius nubinhibens]|nr:damage-inducible protein DinB [Roseovarius nubinhibens]
MARYNLWQNQNLVAAAEALSPAARAEERGAFFGSIAGTFSHLLWADL